MDLSMLATGSSVLQSSPEDLVALYYKTRLLKDLQTRFLPTEAESLDASLKKLDIMSKKRILGLPIGSDDYDVSVNEEKPLLTPAIVTAGVASRYFQKPSTQLPALKHFAQPAPQRMPSTKNINAINPVFGYILSKNPPKRAINLNDVLKNFARGAIKNVR
jgi:hypothetical protein